MIIRGPATKYIMNKPELFDPLTAKKGDVFFVNGYPLKKYTYDRKLDWSEDWIWGIDSVGNGREFNIHSSSTQLVKDNPENLNITTSIGLEADIDLPIISIAKPLQAYLKLKRFVKVKRCVNCSVCDLAGGDCTRSCVFDDYTQKLITGDTGPNARFVEEIIVQAHIILVKGRAFDLPSKIFEEFEPDPKVGMIYLEVEF